ncbi:MAG: DHH family phosphoesterase [Candidatus Micrarchaeota archaeon]|nr:DHH family phosphoesterase [Candidatus Micrarchaeota archaeon]
MKRDFAGFEKAAREAGKHCLEAKNPLVVNHFDADGISAGAIVCRAFRKNGVNYSEVTVRRAGSFGKWGAFKEIVFCDLGGEEEKALKAFPGKTVFVFDHHPPARPLEELPDNVIHVNPHFYGIDGASECSASTATYFGFREKYAVELAVAGAVGDTQDFGPAGSLFGVNKVPVREGGRARVIETRTSLKLVGAAWKPLDKLISEAIAPAIPDFLDDRKAAARFLQASGLDENAAYSELPEVKKRLLKELLSRRVRPGAAAPLFGEVYFFPREKEKVLSTATEYAAVLNACGRQGKADDAIKMCLGGKAALAKAKKVVARHEELLPRELFFAKQKAADMGKFVLVDGRGKIRESSVGNVAGALLASGLSGSKPVLSMATAPGQTKFSARAGKGSAYDFGKILAEAAEAVGGNGGGHAVAAGASIPAGCEKKFLALFSAAL